MTDRLATLDDEETKSGQGRVSYTDEQLGMRAALRSANGRKMFASILYSLYYGRSVSCSDPEGSHALAAIQQQGTILARQLKEADPDNFWAMLKEQDNA